jgi:hypothetical protein
MKIYLVGSLRNPGIPVYANQLREHGFDIFDDWHAVDQTPMIIGWSMKKLVVVRTHKPCRDMLRRIPSFLISDT